MHLGEPVVLYVPFSQFLHTVDDVAPVALLYVPAEHGVHDAMPSTLLYVPAGHFLHLYVPPEP